jgi:hypothetical protein
MKKGIVTSLLCLCLVGCYTTQGFVKYEDSKLENVQLAIQGTKTMLQTLDFRTGLLVGIFEPYKDEIPQNIIQALKESRELVKKYQEEGELSDYEYGKALGLQIRLKSEVVTSLVKKYAPTALHFIGGI